MKGQVAVMALLGFSMMAAVLRAIYLQMTMSGLNRIETRKCLASDFS
jgi:hypothetical protein